MNFFGNKRIKGEGRNLKFGRIQLLTLCKSSQTDRNLQFLHNISHRVGLWMNICPASLGEAIFSITLMKTSLQSEQSHLVSVQHQLPRPSPRLNSLPFLGGFLVTVVESLLLTTWFLAEVLKTAKYTFFDVLLQCERGQRNCVFVKYKIYHQSISKHNV